MVVSLTAAASHAMATAGHHIHRCSAPASPRPHKGHAPKRDTTPRAPCRLPLRLRSSVAFCRREGGIMARGRAAQASPSLHPPAQGAHHASPGCGAASVSGHGDDHAKQTASPPQLEQTRAARWLLGLHLAFPGSPLQRKRMTLPASVTVLAARSRRHSSPEPGAHRRSAALRAIHAECTRP